MRIEFPQGVPNGCTAWLRENVGLGNIEENSNSKRTRHWLIDNDDYAWFYERIVKPVPPNAFGDFPFEYVPTITVKDEKLAVLFALRWS